MPEIPQILEDLYETIVMIPDEKDWPPYLAGTPAVARNLYSFYYGLRAGYQLHDALRKEPLPFFED